MPATTRACARSAASPAQVCNNCNHFSDRVRASAKRKAATNQTSPTSKLAALR